MVVKKRNSERGSLNGEDVIYGGGCLLVMIVMLSMIGGAYLQSGKLPEEGYCVGIGLLLGIIFSLYFLISSARSKD